MLTAEENAQLTRVGPGTLIGDLVRQYWIPVVLPPSSRGAAAKRPLPPGQMPTRGRHRPPGYSVVHPCQWRLR